HYMIKADGIHRRRCSRASKRARTIKVRRIDPVEFQLVVSHLVRGEQPRSFLVEIRHPAHVVEHLVHYTKQKVAQRVACRQANTCFGILTAWHTAGAGTMCLVCETEEQ